MKRKKQENDGQNEYRNREYEDMRGQEIEERQKDETRNTGTENRKT